MNFRRADSRELLVTSRRLVPAYSRGFTRVTSSTSRTTSAVRSCRVKQLPPSRPTGLAPRRLGTRSPLSYIEDLYLLQYFPRPSPPPSGLRLGRVFRRLDRVLPVVQPLGLTVELPLTTHGPSSSRTWIGGPPGRTLLGTPQGLRRRRSRRLSA